MKERVSAMLYESSRQNSPAVVPGFHYRVDAVPCEFDTQQRRQVQQTSMIASAYDSEDAHIKKIMMFLLRNLMSAITLVHRGRFFKLLLKWTRKKPNALL